MHAVGGRGHRCVAHGRPGLYSNVGTDLQPVDTGGQTNKDDMFYLGSKPRPMTVTREKGVLVARAVLGVASQGNRGFRNLFR
jgi:hypothetical protein